MKEYAFKLDSSNMLLASSGTQTNTKWDSTGGVEGTVSVYYSQDGSNFLVTRVTGSWAIHQSGDAIKNGSVKIVCVEGFDSSQTITKNISGSSFDISTGFTKYANSGAGLVGIGAKSSITIYRIQSGTSWTLDVSNVIASTISF